MKDLTNATITKKAKESIIKEQIVEVLRKANKALTLLEIQKEVPNASRKLMKELEFDNVKAIHHFEHNSNKAFTHPETKKTEKIRGTFIYKYILRNIKREDN